MKKIIFAIFLCTTMLTACGTRHKTILHEYQESTCSSLGHEAYYECQKCQKYYSDDHITEITNIPTISKKEHVLDEVNDPFGHFYGGECSVCGYKEPIKELPVISINTVTHEEIEGDRLHSEYYDSTVSVTNCEDEYILDNVEASVKVRGNYTADYGKKPYRIKFDSKHTMLGLNNNLKAKSWVLLAEYKDRSLLRNMVAFTLGHKMLDEYTSDYRYVVVYVNNIYRGLYLLCEQQQVNKGRVAISEPNENYKGVDIGYFMELDSYASLEDELNCFTMNYRSLLYKDGSVCPTSKLIKYYTIKSDIYSAEQTSFIQKTMNNIFSVCYDAINNNHENSPYKTLDNNNNICDDASIKTPEEAINRVIDIDSLVNVLLLNEVCLDMDIGWSSFYMYYDMKGTRKLTFTAPWDFDSALGYSVGETNILLSSYPYDSTDCGCETPKKFTNVWLVFFANEEWFNDKLIKRWQEVKGVYYTVIANIDTFCSTYQTYITDNFIKWPADNYTSLSEHEYYEYHQCISHSSSANYLKKFITERFDFLNNIFSEKKHILK